MLPHPNPLAAFMTNPSGSAIVNAVGPIRQILNGEDKTRRRYLVILFGTPSKPGRAVQIQALD
jgi:hypothetical protein